MDLSSEAKPARDEPRGETLKRPIAAGVAALLIAVFAAQAILSLRTKSVTTDEIMYIAAGYHHIQTGTFDFNTVNPPLMKLLAAVPLLGLNLELPKFEGGPRDWGQIRQWQFSREFLYANRVSHEEILVRSRMLIVLLGCGLGLYVFAWSRGLYGDRAGLLALALYAFSPNVLAHTRLSTLDLGVTAFMIACLYHYWRFIERPTTGQLMACAAALSAAILSKTTGWFLAPILVLHAGVLAWRCHPLGVWDARPWVRVVPASLSRLRSGAAVGGVLVALGLAGLVGLNAGYAFQGTLAPIGSGTIGERVRAKLPEGSTGRSVADLALMLPSPVPRPMVDSAVFQRSLTSVGNRVFLRGETSTNGIWNLMPIAFLIKTPLPVLVLTLVVIIALVRARQVSNGETLILIAAAFTLAVFFYLKQVAVGVRYLLPVYPLLHVLAGRVVREIAGTFWRRGALALMVLWLGVGTLSVYPDYLAYFNESIGGPDNGWKWLADSHLDWGQDLEQLEAWMRENEVERVRLAYFGSADARAYDISYEYLPSVGLAPTKPGELWWFEGLEDHLPTLDLSRGPIVISATLLAGVFLPGYYEPLRQLEPVAQIGHSLLVFDAVPSARHP